MARNSKLIRPAHCPGHYYSCSTFLPCRPRFEGDAMFTKQLCRKAILFSQHAQKQVPCALCL